MAETVVVMPVETTESLWARITLRLKNWGRKVKSGTTRFFSWLYNSKVVQWTITKTKALAGWAWGYLRGPVGWVAAPIAAIIFAPKAVAVMLTVVLIALAIVGYFVYRSYRHLKTITSPEEFRSMVDELRDAIEEPIQINSIDEPLPTAEETLESRFEWLDDQMEQARAAGDSSKISAMAGRLHYLTVRMGNGGKLKRDATASDIYRNSRQHAERTMPGFDWDWIAMNNAIKNEDKRYRQVKRLRHERDAALTVS